MAVPVVVVHSGSGTVTMMGGMLIIGTGGAGGGGFPNPGAPGKNAQQLNL